MNPGLDFEDIGELPATAIGIRLGLVLRHHRRQRKLSLAEASRMAGGRIKRSTLSAYERGIRTVPEKQLYRLAQIYGTTVEQMWAEATAVRHPDRGR